MKTKIIEDKNKFYNKLFCYKSFLYKNTLFESNIDDEEVQNIIKALNIKNKAKRIEFIYDYCCDRIDKYYEGKDLCKFENQQCLNHRIENVPFLNGCCRICSYQGDNGCTTKNMACKLFYCDRIKESNKLMKFSDLKILKLFSLRQRLMAYENFFCKQRRVFNRIKSWTIIVPFIKNSF